MTLARIESVVMTEAQGAFRVHVTPLDFLIGISSSRLCDLASIIERFGSLERD